MRLSSFTAMHGIPTGSYLGIPFSKVTSTFECDACGPMRRSAYRSFRRCRPASSRIGSRYVQSHLSMRGRQANHSRNALRNQSLFPTAKPSGSCYWARTKHILQICKEIRNVTQSTCRVETFTRPYARRSLQSVG